MESDGDNLCSVIQYYKGPDTNTRSTDVGISDTLNSQVTVEENINESIIKNDNKIFQSIQESNHECKQSEDSKELFGKIENIKNFNGKIENNECFEIKSEPCIKQEVKESDTSFEEAERETPFISKSNLGVDDLKLKSELSEFNKLEKTLNNINIKESLNETKDLNSETENEGSVKGKKRTLSEANADAESFTASAASAEELEANEDEAESDFDEDDDEDSGNKPRKRGRCKKNVDIIPSHLSSDMVLGYKVLLKFLETPQFSGFHKPFKKSADSEENCKITCLNQIKKKFEENSYKKVSEFVSDVREMLINIYESRNQVAIKKALRLEQILEQRIAQLPNYLRPQCALILPSDEVNNCHNKIRITKGGGFVSLLLEKTEKKRYEKNKEKRKLLAEERKQLKEEQNKDVQEWEKNVLMKDFEEDIKSMWEVKTVIDEGINEIFFQLPAIGHFIHLCADIFNIGEVAQFEVERMLLMPQCSDTLDLIMTALLTNSLMRAKLDRTPSMPYSIWGPLVRTRVMSWYRLWHRDGRNEQKIFEEIGIEPEFWQILGPDINPLDYYYFHELSLLQRVWILKTLCDVDFVRKKTVYDNIRAQTLDELNPVHLGLDQQGNRYIQFKQFSGSDIRIYRQSTKLEGDITPSELIESSEGFEYREGAITVEKVFKDIWELNEKSEVKVKKKKVGKAKKAKNFSAKVKLEPGEKRSLRQSAREKRKTYVDWSDSDQSDTDLRTLRNKLIKPETETLYRPFSDKEFISLSVFRLPREKVNKPTPKRSSYVSRRADDSNRNDSDKNIKTETEERKDDNKTSVCEDEQSDSLDAKQSQAPAEFEKTFTGDDMNEDDFDLREKISNCELDNADVKFTVKNLENLKMVFKKGSSMGEDESRENLTDTVENSESEEKTSSRGKEYDSLYKYNVPSHLKPDSNKFYLVVDSVEGLRQLISKFGSHENDLEIITRSTIKTKKKSNSFSNTSSEVQLIEKLQNLLIELEPWELDLMKSTRSNKEKMYKEYMNFLNRPPNFVHPNESYWMKTYEEPNVTTASATASTTSVTTTTAESSTSNTDKTTKEGCSTSTESTSQSVSQQESSADYLGLRKRTRVTRIQLQPESDDLDEDFDDADDYESNESDDNWVLPVPKKRAKKEAANRTPKLPKRSGGRKVKSSPFEKTETFGEKSQSSSPEKIKKALFWGPRSTDPSEDLNWETNRQKILEQHNSPIKKALRTDEDSSKVENTLKSDSASQSVIIASPKRLPTQVLGNKKPYYSSAQLKAIESQAKKTEEETPHRVYGVRTNSSTPDSKILGSSDSPLTCERNKTPAKIQTYSRVKKMGATQSGIVNCQTVNKPVQSLTRIGTSAVADSQVASAEEPGQKLVGSIQIHQPIARQQIQVQDCGQNRVITSVANVKVSGQPVQWQQKVINVQSVNQPGKIVQHQLPSQQLQSVTQTQGQQIAIVESQKPAGQSSVPMSQEKLGNFLQMIASQGQSGLNLEGDLYITDGKNLMKFDNNFVQQLQNDKVVALDLKKTLLLVKPKTDPNVSTSQSQTQAPQNQQNIFVLNKPATAVQQTVATSTVPSFVIPANYIIKEGNQSAQSEQGEQTVKIFQQAPTYVLQQKPVANKTMQPQVIKIITSQPVGSNQNLILAPVTGQVIQPITQNVISADQHGKLPTTLRLVRPQIATSTPNSGQSKVGQMQSPVIINNLVQIQGQKLETPKPATSVVAGRIVSTGVPAVRMATPQTVVQSTQAFVQGKTLPSANSQTQTIVTNLSQGIRANVITQPVRLATVSQGQVQTSVNVTNSSPRFVVSTTQAMRLTAAAQSPMQASSAVNQTQTVRYATNPQIVASSVSSPQVIKTTGLSSQQVKLATTQPHTVIQTSSVNTQLIGPTTTLGTQTVRLVNQPQFVQTQALIASTNPSSQMTGSPGNLGTQTVKIVQPQQYQTQTVVPCVNLNSQTVRLATNVNSQPIRFVQSHPVRLVANSNVGVKFINRSPTPVKAAVITNASSAVSNIRPSGVTCQPVRYQTIVQASGMQVSTPKKVVNANTLAEAPVLVVEEKGETVVGEKVTEPPITLDYINGELSVKKTSQGWKYAVKASNGKDIILTDEQIEERVKANNGVMK